MIGRIVHWSTITRCGVIRGADRKEYAVLRNYLSSDLRATSPVGALVVFEPTDPEHSPLYQGSGAVGVRSASLSDVFRYRMRGVRLPAIMPVPWSNPLSLTRRKR